MKKQQGSKARDQRNRRQEGAPRPSKFKAKGQAPRPGFRGKPGQKGKQAQRGAQICPMCGAVVTNLRGHISERHDDTQSHPID